MSDQRPPNRLARESSPYLLQHAHNPVDWYPWGPEAIGRAQAEQKPIFLSIGYSACHWCHVMERESFENDKIAALMNEHFVNIKVDREERPDLDQIYMAAVQAMTGHGGWPMTVFLTPELKPFYGGTYFPPQDARGMPGFDRVLQSVAQAWAERRSEILEAANGMTAQLDGLGRVPPGSGLGFDHRLFDEAVRGLARAFDPVHGGFGSAPKFPHPMDLKVLLRQYARVGDVQALHMVRHTLDKMARGGIYDHLGGGFARYSTDDRWLVPHFEKMLYDNALLASVYLEAYQVTHDPEYARVARETLDYVLGRMTSTDGAFYSTEDADSEGVEGKYYVWSLDEVESVLGEDAARTFAYVYDVTREGNWEHVNILNMTKPIDQAARMLQRDPDELGRDLSDSRARLLAVRDQRVPPGKDTKVLAAWNGLMIAALAPAGAILGDQRYVDAARRAAAFLIERMSQPDGRLWHAFMDGRAHINGFLDDYACAVDGLTRLFEASGEPRWAQEAVRLADVLLDQFHDADAPGFFFTGKDHEALVVRPKELIDNATPAANAMAATALLRLGALTGRADFTDAGTAAVKAVEGVMRSSYPTAAGQSLIALDFLLGNPAELALIAGVDPNEFQAARTALASKFRPRAVLAPAPGPVPPDLARLVPLLADRPALDGKTTLYVCRDFTCERPLVGLARIANLEP